jgi:hypothetical protein
MSEWDAPVGTVLVEFEDGSAIVKSDGSESDIDEMVRFFADAETGTVSEQALSLIRVLVGEGLALKAYVSENETRALARDHLSMVANTLRDLGLLG